MSSSSNSDEVHVKCDVCLKEIPASEAKSAEATDYIAHFCGHDCYQKWQDKVQQEKPTEQS